MMPSLEATSDSSYKACFVHRSLGNYAKDQIIVSSRIVLTKACRYCGIRPWAGRDTMLHRKFSLQGFALGTVRCNKRETGHL